MLKTTTIRARITPTVKTQAERILSSLGMTASDAIQLLFHQIQLRRGLPFQVELPNAETVKVLRESRKGKGVKHYASKKDLYRDLGLWDQSVAPPHLRRTSKEPRREAKTSPNLRRPLIS